MTPTAMNNDWCAGAPDRTFRRLETRRGDFFVRWAPDHVSALLCSLALRPDDIAPEDPQRRHDHDSCQPLQK